MCEEVDHEELKEFKARAMEIVEVALKERRLHRGIRLFLETLTQQEGGYYEAIQNGAIKIELPPEVEETGEVMWECQCQHNPPSRPGTLERILLNFEYTVWTCPKCGKVYAFRIQQPEEMEGK